MIKGEREGREGWEGSGMGTWKKEEQDPKKDEGGNLVKMATATKVGEGTRSIYGVGSSEPPSPQI